MQSFLFIVILLSTCQALFVQRGSIAIPSDARRVRLSLDGRVAAVLSLGPTLYWNPQAFNAPLPSGDPGNGFRLFAINSFPNNGSDGGIMTDTPPTYSHSSTSGSTTYFTDLDLAPDGAHVIVVGNNVTRGHNNAWGIIINTINTTNTIPIPIPSNLPANLWLAVSCANIDCSLFVIFTSLPRSANPAFAPTNWQAVSSTTYYVAQQVYVYQVDYHANTVALYLNEAPIDMSFVGDHGINPRFSDNVKASFTSTLQIIALARSYSADDLTAQHVLVLRRTVVDNGSGLYWGDWSMNPVYVSNPVYVQNFPPLTDKIMTSFSLSGPDWIMVGSPGSAVHGSVDWFQWNDNSYVQQSDYGNPTLGSHGLLGNAVAFVPDNSGRSFATDPDMTPSSSLCGVQYTGGVDMFTAQPQGAANPTQFQCPDTNGDATVPEIGLDLAVNGDGSVVIVSGNGDPIYGGGINAMYIFRNVNPGYWYDDSGIYPCPESGRYQPLSTQLQLMSGIASCAQFASSLCLAGWWCGPGAAEGTTYVQMITIPPLPTTAFVPQADSETYAFFIHNVDVGGHGITVRLISRPDWVTPILSAPLDVMPYTTSTYAITVTDLHLNSTAFYRASDTLVFSWWATSNPTLTFNLTVPITMQVTGPVVSPPDGFQLTPMYGVDVITGEFQIVNSLCALANVTYQATPVNCGTDVVHSQSWFTLIDVSTRTIQSDLGIPDYIHFITNFSSTPTFYLPPTSERPIVTVQCVRVYLTLNGVNGIKPFIKELNITANVLQACPAGYTSRAGTGTNVEGCDVCPFNQYQDVEGSNQCKVCGDNPIPPIDELKATWHELTVTLRNGSFSPRDCASPSGVVWYDGDLYKCPVGAKCPLANSTAETVAIQPGYWRVDNQSIVPLLCPSSVVNCDQSGLCVPVGESFCLGQDQCREGHQGAFCADCVLGRVRRFYCTEHDLPYCCGMCSDSDTMDARVSLSLFVVLVAFVLTVVFFCCGPAAEDETIAKFLKVRREHLLEKCACLNRINNSCLCAAAPKCMTAPVETLYRMLAKMRKYVNFEEGDSTLKTLTAFLQVSSSMSYVLLQLLRTTNAFLSSSPSQREGQIYGGSDGAAPTVSRYSPMQLWTGLSNLWAVFTFNVRSLFDLGCATPNYSHFTELLAAIIMPICLAFFIWLLYFCSSRVYTRFDFPALVKYVHKTALWMSLWCLFVFWPGVMSVLANTLPCREFRTDPNFPVEPVWYEGSTSRLRIDVTISCNMDGPYGGYKILAIIFLVLYGILPGVAHCFVMWNGGPNAEGSEFYWRPYKAAWFISANMIFTFCQTTVPGLVGGAENSPHAASGTLMFVTGLELIFIAYIRPHRESTDNFLALLAQWGIFSMAFVVLLTSLDPTGIEVNLDMMAALAVVAFWVPVVTLGVRWCTRVCQCCKKKTIPDNDAFKPFTPEPPLPDQEHGQHPEANFHIVSKFIQGLQYGTRETMVKARVEQIVLPQLNKAMAEVKERIKTHQRLVENLKEQERLTQRELEWIKSQRSELLVKLEWALKRNDSEEKTKLLKLLEANLDASRACAQVKYVGVVPEQHEKSLMDSRAGTSTTSPSPSPPAMITV